MNTMNKLDQMYFYFYFYLYSPAPNYRVSIQAHNLPIDNELGQKACLNT